MPEPVVEIEYNSPAYYAKIFDPAAADILARAEQQALVKAQRLFGELSARTQGLASEADKLRAIFSGSARVNFTDFDGTRSRLDDLGEARNAEVDLRTQELIEMEGALGINTIKVSGRPLVWPGIGLLADIQNLPKLAIGEAGAVMAIDGFPSIAYQDQIDRRTGFNKAELTSELTALLGQKSQAGGELVAFRAQPQNQITHKLAFDVQFAAGVDGDQAMRVLQAELQAIVGDRAKVVQCHFIEARNAGILNSYRIDIVPGDKADATNYVAAKLQDGQTKVTPIITAGDSGNDLGLVSAAPNLQAIRPQELIGAMLDAMTLNTNVFIAVANRHPDLRAEIDRVAVPASQFSDNTMLKGLYFMLDGAGNVAKLIVDDSELRRFRTDLPEANRYGPESILNAYQFLFPN